MTRKRRRIGHAATGVFLALALVPAPTAGAVGFVPDERTVPVGSSPIQVVVEANARHHIDWNWQVNHVIVGPDGEAPRNVVVDPDRRSTHEFVHQVTVTPTRQDFLRVNGLVTVHNWSDEPMRIKNLVIKIDTGETKIASPPLTELAESILIPPKQARALDFSYVVARGGAGSTDAAEEFLSGPQTVSVDVTRAGGPEPSPGPDHSLTSITTTRSDVSAVLTSSSPEFDGPITLDADSWDGEPWVFTYRTVRGADRRGLPFDFDDDGRLLRDQGASQFGVYPSWADVEPSGGEIPAWVGPQGRPDGQDPRALSAAEVITISTRDLLKLAVVDVRGEYTRNFDWTVSHSETGGLGEHYGSQVQLAKVGTGAPFEFKTEVRAEEVGSTPLVLTGTVRVVNDASVARPLRSLTVMVDGTAFPGALVDPPGEIAARSSTEVEFSVDVAPGDLVDGSGEAVDVFAGTRVVSAEAQFAELSDDGAVAFDLRDADATVTGQTARLSGEISATGGVTDGFADPRVFEAEFGRQVELAAGTGDSWVFTYPVTLGEHLSEPGSGTTFTSVAVVTPDGKAPVEDREVVRVGSGQPLYVEGSMTLNVEQRIDWTLAEAGVGAGTGAGAGAGADAGAGAGAGAGVVAGVGAAADSGAPARTGEKAGTGDSGATARVRSVTATPTMTETTSSATGTITVWNPNRTSAWVTMYGLTDVVDANGEPFPVQIELVALYGEPIEPDSEVEFRVPPRYAERVGQLRLGLRFTFPEIDPADFPELTAIVGWDPEHVATEADTATRPIHIRTGEPTLTGPDKITVLAESPVRPSIVSRGTGTPAKRDNVGGAWIIGEASLPRPTTFRFQMPSGIDQPPHLTWRPAPGG